MAGEREGDRDVRQRASAAGDAYVAGRDIHVHQGSAYLSQPSPAGREGGGRAITRRLLAQMVLEQLEDLDGADGFRRERFVELGAEVEGTGGPVRSILAELERSKEPFIVLLGKPGAGKSVTLRQLGRKLAERAARAPARKRVIPLYVNLREFRPATDPISQDEIRDFILSRVIRGGDSWVTSFLREEFRRGRSRRRWLFLLDSFDEIPALLSSAAAGPAIERYEAAFKTFLSGTNCRGIIASRDFRGPRRLIKAKFSIVQLSDQQKQELARKAGLAGKAREKLVAGLGAADPALAGAFDIPLTFALLCEYMKTGKPFPRDTRAVFQDYVKTRLEHSHVRGDSGIPVDGAVRAAEEAAFAMSTQPGTGPALDRSAIRAAVAASGRFKGDVDAALDALEDSKLVLSGDSTSADGRRIVPFAFIHRSFQEYFAAGAILRVEDGMPARVEDDTLLKDPRLREAAVMMLQSDDRAVAGPLLGRAAELLRGMASGLASAGQAGDDPGRTGPPGGQFSWPDHSLHVLGLLNSALSRDPEQLPDGLRADAGRLVMAGWELGDRLDRKWAIESAPVADPEVAAHILRESFESGSILLAEVAYAQARRFRELPESLDLRVRRELVGLARRGRLRKGRVAAEARLRVLAQPDEFLRGMTLLIVAPYIDFALVFAAASLCWSSSLFSALSAGVANAAFCAFSFRLLRAALGRKARRKPARREAVNPVTATLNNLIASDPGIYGAFLRVLPVSWMLPAAVTESHFFAIPAVFYAIWWAPSAMIAFVSGGSASIGSWLAYPFRVAWEVLHLLADTTRRLGGWLARQARDWRLINGATQPGHPLRISPRTPLGMVLLLMAPPLATAAVFLYTAVLLYLYILMLVSLAFLIGTMIADIAKGDSFLSVAAGLAAIGTLNSVLIYYAARRRDKRVVEEAVPELKESAGSLPAIVAGIRTRKGFDALIRSLQQEKLSADAERAAVAFLREFIRYVASWQRDSPSSAREGPTTKAPSPQDRATVILHKLLLLLADPWRLRNPPPRDLPPDAAESEPITAWLQARKPAKRPADGQHPRYVTAWQLTCEAITTPIGPWSVSAKTLDEIARFIEKRPAVKPGRPPT